jgi:hypothetical protein
VRHIKQRIDDAGWKPLPVAEILGDGAPWIGHVAEAHVPGVRPTLDSDHLSEHLYAVAPLRFPDAPEPAKPWVEGQQAALLTDRVGEVLGALPRLRKSPVAGNSEHDDGHAVISEELPGGPRRPKPGGGENPCWT